MKTEQPMVNKEDLITAIIAGVDVKRTGGPDRRLLRAEAEQALMSLTEALTVGLVGGRAIRLTGIGSFHTRISAARNSRNPRTGETVVVPSRREVKFVAAQSLKDAVAENG
jgi:DNA-binding protein HU-beta